jgi:SPP1 family predicted phage head-tail adaptor
VNYPHRMTIERRTTSQDSFGGQSSEWSVVGVYWCRISALSGRALETAQVLHSETTHDICMQYDSTITAKDRGIFRGRYFEFGVVQNVDEADIETRILASEGLTEG